MPDELQVPASLRVVTREGRPVHTFTVPADSQAEVGFTSVSLVELTADEEMAVMSKMKAVNMGAATRVQYELVKATFTALNGKQLPVIGEELDQAWNSIGPKGRALLLQAYQSLHQVKKAVTDGFLASRTTTA